MKQKKERLSVYISKRNRDKGSYRDVIINGKKCYHITLSIFNNNLYIKKANERNPIAMATSYKKIESQLRILLKQRYPNKIIYIYYR